MNPQERAERALRHAPIMPMAKSAVLVFVEQEIVEAETVAANACQNLLIALEELVSIVDDCARDEYAPDSSTSRSARIAIGEARKCFAKPAP